jgi:hypothetical protein
MCAYENKTKYNKFTRNLLNLKHDLDIDGQACEKVSAFTYCGILKRVKNDNNEEIKMRMVEGNHCCYAGF